MPTTCQPHPGHEADYYFGCWIDNNQTVGILPTSLPNVGLPAAGTQLASLDGPWPSGTQLGSMKQAMTAFPHQCLIAEIRYDDTPVPAGANTSDSDKLAQRNIAWIDGPNPGLVASRRMAHPIQLRPTPLAALTPDELMIQWGNTPVDSEAQLYFPSLDAGALIDGAETKYPVQQLRQVDAHTSRLRRQRPDIPAAADRLGTDRRPAFHHAAAGHQEGRRVHDFGKAVFNPERSAAYTAARLQIAAATQSFVAGPIQQGNLAGRGRCVRLLAQH